jgi:serine/threonine-protein kinase
VTVTCPTCGTELRPGARFCPRDGTTVRPDTAFLPSEAASPAGATTQAPTEPEGQAGHDAILNRVLDGRYRILATLGQGGIGAVYEGEHVEMKKRVAVKVLHSVFAKTDSFLRRFEREARSASRLSHPGCVSIIDFGRVSRVDPAVGGDALIGMPYLVMEFVKGELLRDRIDRARMPPYEALMITRGALSALRHAHELGLVHRDIKPPNIMLAATGEPLPLVKLLDFGLAKNISEGSPDVQQALTEMGMVFGTPGYLSPEQAAGKQADARSDLYSVGVVLFEMICGCPPFERPTAVEVVRDHLLTPPPRPTKFMKTLSPELEAVILRALEKDPAKRPQTAEEFQTAIAACPEASRATPGTTTAPSATRQLAFSRERLTSLVRSHRKELLRGGAGLVAVGLTALIVILARAPKPALMITAPQPAASIPAAVATSPISPSARHHLATAEDYQRRLWCSDVIEELDRALSEAPELAAEPEVTRIAIPCLRAKTQEKTMRFLIERVGANAKAELRAAAASESKADVREGAERVLARLGEAP